MEETTRHYEVEESVTVPLDCIDPETLRTMVKEFVTRDWSELCDGDHTLEEKTDQVIKQLRDKKAKVVFDMVTETCNIVVT